MPPAMTELTRFTRADMRGYAPPPGAHVSVLGVTGGGKTTLLGQLVRVQSDDQLTVIFDTKPRNKELGKQLAGLGFRTVHEFPPALPKIRLAHERRWIVRPPHVGNPGMDGAVLYATAEHTIGWLYNHGHKYGGCRLVVDEVQDFTRGKALGYRSGNAASFLDMCWTHGRSQELGLWAGTQRPRDVPLNMFSQATDIFLGQNPDAQDVKRYGEFGGVSPILIRDTIASMKRYEFMMVRRTDFSAAIVGAD
jgi:hypothetical protein